VFGEGDSPFDTTPELGFGLMFHGFDYPDETGKNELCSRFCRATMHKGILTFPRPEECEVRRFVRSMSPKEFEIEHNLQSVDQEEVLI